MHTSIAGTFFRPPGLRFKLLGWTFRIWLSLATRPWAGLCPFLNWIVFCCLLLWLFFFKVYFHRVCMLTVDRERDSKRECDKSLPREDGRATVTSHYFPPGILDAPSVTFKHPVLGLKPLNHHTTCWLKWYYSVSWIRAPEKLYLSPKSRCLWIRPYLGIESSQI